MYDAGVLPEAPGRQLAAAALDGRQRPSQTPAQPTQANRSRPRPLRLFLSRSGSHKRILGIMPNYRAVSAGAIPPPPTPRQAFKIATQNSFDYSSFVFVGITSLLAEGTNAHPQLGKGMPGFGRYYWRGYLDKTDGNYLVIFALPTFLHQDERYLPRARAVSWAVASTRRAVF